MTTQPVDADRALGLVPLEEVPSLLPLRRGRKTHISTIFRWASRGVNGHVLQTVRMGGTKATTRQWLMEFFHALREPKAPAEQPHHDQRPARRPHEALSPTSAVRCESGPI